MTHRVLILLCLLSSGIRLYSQISKTNDEHLRSVISEYGEAEVIVSHPGPAKIDFLIRNFSVSSVDGKVVRARIASGTLDLFTTQKYDYRVEEPDRAKSVFSEKDLEGVMEWDTYPTYTQYLQIMQRFADQYPALCEIDTIGVSNYGKLVLALKISDNVGTDEDEPEVFYSSTLHGDETGGFILMLHLADYLLKNYPAMARVKNLIENLEIWINPLANPDGTYKTGNFIFLPSRFNANEVDLNRNFPDPMSPYNSSNVQQKETSDMVRFLRERRFVLSANFHSGSELVNYPWDAYARNNFRLRDRFHADESWFYRISRAYADTVHRNSEPLYMTAENYGVTRGADWYVIYGGRQDFVTWELQGREVTIELDSAYVTPPSLLLNLWNYNYRSLLGYLENALFGVHGRVRDSSTGKRVAAKVTVAAHDKDSSHVYSDTLTGNFVRMLSPGTYNFYFTARGYRDTVIRDVVVLENRKTSILARLSPLEESVQKYPIIYPNPALNEIRAILSDDFNGPVIIRIYNTTGMLTRELRAESVINKPLIINISSLRTGAFIIVFEDQQKNISLTGRFIVIK